VKTHKTTGYAYGLGILRLGHDSTDASTIQCSHGFKLLFEDLSPDPELLPGVQRNDDGCSVRLIDIVCCQLK